MEQSEVLIVEDDDATRESLALLLELEGYHVATARDGREALNSLHEGERPDVILLDLCMPIMNGREFRSAQLKEENLAGIPVVICSAVVDAEEQVNDLGAVALLSKPIDLGHLRQLLRGITAQS